jgi:hypothetical protein
MIQTTPKIRSLMMDIFSICVDINTLTEHAAFLDLSGHVNLLMASVRKSKTDYETVLYGGFDKSDAYYDFGVDEDGDPFRTESEVVERLEKIKSAISKYLIKEIA